MRATINNPPINLYDYKLSADLLALVNSVENRTDIKIVILDSANPDYWIAHYDIHFISAKFPALPPANVSLVGAAILETRTKLATLPVIFIAEIDQHATGAGNELAVQCDMRFAGPNTRLSQFEIGFNAPPGAGGVQFLVNLIGRARAFEYILSGDYVDAPTAERYGWINRAYASKQQLRQGVDALAQRIATFPKSGLSAIKARINVDKPSDASLKGDNDVFAKQVQTPESEKGSDRYLKLSNNEQGNAFELNLPDGLVELQD